MAETSQPSERPVSSTELLIWCITDEQHTSGSLFQEPEVITKFVGHPVRVRLPNEEGKHEVQVICPACSMRLTKTVIVRGMGPQVVDAGCLWLGCLLPLTLVGLILLVGFLLQDRFSLGHIIVISLVTLAVFGGLFALAVRRTRRKGLQILFDDLATTRAAIGQHRWSRLSVGREQV